jgi:hypothetical protein
LCKKLIYRGGGNFKQVHYWTEKKFFLDEAWFTLSRNVMSQSNRYSPSKKSPCNFEVLLQDLKFVVRHACFAVIT